jgi:hypothetical protein
MDLPEFKRIKISGDFMIHTASIEMFLDELKDPEIICNFCDNNNTLVETMRIIYTPENGKGDIIDLSLRVKKIYELEAKILGLNFDSLWWAMATQQWFESMFTQRSGNAQGTRKKASKRFNNQKNNVQEKGSHIPPWSADLFRFPEYAHAIQILMLWKREFDKSIANNNELASNELHKKYLGKIFTSCLEERHAELKSKGESKSFICQFCHKRTVVNWQSRQRKSCDDCTNKYSVLTTKRNRQQPSANKKKVDLDLVVPRIERKRGFCKDCGKRRSIKRDGMCKQCID